MKKTVKWILFVIFTITLISCQGQVNNENNAEYERAEKSLKDHLVKRYGEEFEIFLMGRREFNNKVWYEAEIMPQKYIGTPKENDSYYWATGNVNVNGSYLEAGDTYGRVLINEGANEFFGKKVEELFGPNYLCAINVEGPYTYRNFAQESESRKKMYEKNPEGKYDPISGRIYIFGKIKENSDKEIYRKKIFELIKYFKKTGTFEYVSLSINILDERCLTEKFEFEIGYKLLGARNNLKTADEFLIYRKGVMEDLDDEYKKINVESKIKFLNKSRLTSRNDYSIYLLSRIYHTAIWSEKFLEKEVLFKGYNILYYDNLEEVKLLNSIKVEYEEYNVESLKKNAWDGE